MTSTPERPSALRGRRARAIIAALALVVSPWSGRIARAHSLLVSRGEAVVAADRVRVSIEVFAEDFLHYEPLRVSADGSLDLADLTSAEERHGVALARELAVIDGRGDRLECLAATTRAGWSTSGRATIEELKQLRAQYELTFRLSSPTPVLTFRVIRSEQRINVQSQCVLRAICAGFDTHRTLRLTSGGNTESVELTWSRGAPRLIEPTSLSGHADSAMPFDPRGPLRFNDVCLDVSLDDEVIRATAYIPLPLWESFQLAARADENRLTVEEIEALQRSAGERLRGMLSVAGDADWPFVVTVDSPRDPVVGDANVEAQAGAVSFWAARLVVRYEPRTIQAGDVPGLSWNLFNELVMTAEAVVRTPRGARSLGLSPFERGITIR